MLISRIQLQAHQCPHKRLILFDINPTNWKSIKHTYRDECRERVRIFNRYHYIEDFCLMAVCKWIFASISMHYCRIPTSTLFVRKGCEKTFSNIVKKTPIYYMKERKFGYTTYHTTHMYLPYSVRILHTYIHTNT